MTWHDFLQSCTPSTRFANGIACTYARFWTHSSAGISVAVAWTCRYFPGLQNLVGSVRFWCPHCSIAFYDLGLAAEQLAEVRTWCRVSIRTVANLTRHGNAKQVRAADTDHGLDT